MADVNVSIAGRQYRMACDDGQEERLEGLARRLDAKITELRKHFGEIGDQRITVMAALTFADEVHDVERRAAALEQTIAGLRAADQANQDRIEAANEAVAAALVALSGRIERIAGSLVGD